ncbi:MAG: MBL fold metallo-hydrolase [Thermovirgaceae bacterium]
MRIRRFALGALWTNGYLVVDDDGRGVFVDPGGDPKEVMEFMEQQGLKLEWILLTHGHADHICGLEKLRPLARWGVAVHSLDAFMLGSPEQNLSAFMQDRCLSLPPEKELEDGDTIHAGGLVISVIHTPGHTPGSVCFHVSEEGEEALLSGDTLFAQSVGRTDLPGGDQGKLLESLEKIDSFPDELVVFPGHGPQSTIGTERRKNPFWPGDGK